MDAKIESRSESHDIFLKDVLQGLSTPQKTLPCKYFYDETGSKLFEAICQCDEYYITRTELELIDSLKKELADRIGPGAAIIEPGAGAGIKIQTLFSALDSPALYVPMDISSDFLFYSANQIQQRFPAIEVMPIQGDFTQPIKWMGEKSHKNRVVFFPGSTIGNFTPKKAQEFLGNLSKLIGKKGAIIIGVDLIKSRCLLEQAYNDKQGVTADFNMNLLARINNELEANFDLSQFKHEAIFNPVESRIEMHLKSKVRQKVQIKQQEFEFQPDESIHTENSYKYSLENFSALIEQADLRIDKTWIDDNNLISLHYLIAE